MLEYAAQADQRERDATQQLRAFQLMLEGHGTTPGRDGLPYFMHPMTVASRMRTAAERQVAAMHDLIEDTSITLQRLRDEGFSDEVINGVDSVSRRPGESRMDAARRVLFDPVGLFVKVEDLLHNLDPSRLPEMSPQDHSLMAAYRKVLAFFVVSLTDRARWDDERGQTAAAALVRIVGRIDAALGAGWCQSALGERAMPAASRSKLD